VTINGATYAVTPDASGNWSVDTETATPASGTLGTFSDGNTYQVVTTVTDGAGNTATDASTDELVIDTTDPTTPTVDALTSNDTTPVISGTTGTGGALPSGETMTVTINGATYAVTPDASGNWSVDTETATPASGTLGAFSDGNTYPVVATVTDGAGNTATDGSTDELVIDTTDPTVPTVVSQTTSDTTPVITGTTGTGSALASGETMTVTINGATYAVTPDASGNWSVDTETATPASGTLGTFSDGNTYQVVTTVTDGAGNTATDASTDELVIDSSVPTTPTVDALTSNDTTPVITGTTGTGAALPSGETMTVTINGATYAVTPDASGNWSVDTETATPASGTLGTFTDGNTYPVVATVTDGAGNTATDASTDELVIDSSVPTTPTVDALTSNDTTPVITGTTGTGAALPSGETMTVTINGATYAVTPDASGNWSVDTETATPASGTLGAFSDGNTYQVVATVTDGAGNTATDASTDELVIDTTDPTTPTVVSQTTSDTTPVITGTTGTGGALPSGETMTVTINGATYAVTPDASGNWSVDTETATPASGTLGAFSDGNTYSVVATVTDGAGNTATDASTDELVIDTTDPTVPTVVSQTTSDTTPVITGTTGTGGALPSGETMTVTINGATYAVTPDASGNWSVDTETATPASGTLGAFSDGNTYSVVATVTDGAGNTATDASTDELVIDSSVPTTPTVDALTSNDTTPVITGTTGTGAALPSGETMTVTINGATYAVTPDASGNWSVDTETATPASGTLGTFTDGNTYSVVATVTDGAGNTATDASSDELVIDTTDPTTPTVDALTSNDTTPVISGTTGTGGALPSGETMTVTINGATYAVTPDASGNWSVDTETATPASGTLGTFTDGNTYPVVATVTDGAGNTATDASTDELVIDTTDPTVPTVVSQTTSDTTPVISGTTGTGAALPGDENMTVTINGATYAVTPDASGNWSVDTETATPASGTLGAFTDGNTYSVVATVIDGAGNTATDGSTDELVIDSSVPTTPTVDALTSNDTTPVITGTTGTGGALPSGETMTVTINGATYNVTPDASGNWSVDTETATPASGTLGTFTDGNTYPVVATVTDETGNTATDGSTDELVIDTTDPTTPTVDALTSNDTTPVISGTTGTGAALPSGETMTVTINGATYTVTPDASGNWSVDTETATPASGTLGAFSDGNTYQVVTTVTDGAGNSSTDASSDELVIDTTDPTTPTVVSQTTSDTTPVISGTTGTGGALPSGETMTVTINGATYNVTPDASGNWSVDTETATPASGTLGTFTDGNTYPVVATVTDGAGNTATDASTDELVI
ncbi:beta strand repeat-containing protein, partial [Reichenbachiella sp. MSK19-1]|uniref:beta strand repeat-containing protein n=1 Tax=Reichenbachiella sp. MSK19-1 TaxID=1897631 RepID=UPI003519E3B4